MKDAWLISISRSLGGDNAIYKVLGDKPGDGITILNVSLSPQMYPSKNQKTIVYKNDLKIEEFPENIQPHVALSKMGYVVHGVVDFAEVVQPEGENANPTR